jgi:NAD(P)-dependent dehydrogenase (short-subunit alcohol dehydrogenase family)
MKKEEILGLFDVAGKVAIITGATGGFGVMAAKMLTTMGAKVMLTGRNAAKLDQLVKEIVAEGGAADFVAGDPCKIDDVVKVVKATVEKFGGIDILITAAGTNAHAPITTQDQAEWEGVIDANVKGTYLYCREAGKVMIEQGRGGNVIFLGSTRGMVGISDFTAYCTSKGAIHMMAKCLATEWGKHKIRVNAIAPSVFRTELTKGLYENPEIYKMVCGRVPIGRLGEPSDFIGILLYLCSAASDWTTGATFYVDGGFTAD